MQQIMRLELLMFHSLLMNYNRSRRSEQAGAELVEERNGPGGGDPGTK